MPSKRKKCKRCLKSKPTSDFYSHQSNKDGLQGICKSCHLSRHEPQKTGRLTCQVCRQSKSVKEFTPLRSSTTGRSKICKSCTNSAQRRKRIGYRQAKGLPLYRPSKNSERYDDVEYAVASCAGCGRDFEPIHGRSINCSGCSKTYRKLQSMLRAERRNSRGRLQVRKETVQAVLPRFVRQKECAYCGREFKEGTLTKTIDHFSPVCVGGATDDPENLIVCCRECNRSKAWATFDQWLELCQRVVAHAENTT
jgi:5-methylcytosine-specific restriction endonuclease McrA